MSDPSSSTKNTTSKKCPNPKCMCPDCTCGEGCTCGVSPDVICDPCVDFKKQKEAEKMNNKVAEVEQANAKEVGIGSTAGAGRTAEVNDEVKKL